MLIDDDRELTDEEKLLAELIHLDQRIPGDAQIAIPIQLNHTITQITNLFTQHNLPLRDELVAELALWRDHAEQGLKFLHHCDRLMQTVIRSVDTNSP